MQATEILRAEHRVIERVLEALERAGDRLEGAGEVRPGFFDDAVTFIAGFADGCHHRKEEEALFPVMIGSGLPPDGGPIAMMLEEHEEGRRYVREIRDGAARLEGSDPTGRRRLIAAVRAYVALLRDHIQKEDDLLFPMADELLSPPDQERLGAEFERWDAGLPPEQAPDRWRALAERLSLEAAAFAPESGLRPGAPRVAIE